MPRTSPHLITTDKLLKMTGQHADILDITNRLKRHERAVKRLNKAGMDYCPVTGAITRRKP